MAPARSPRGLGKGAWGAREDAADVFAGALQVLHRERLPPSTSQSVTREMGGLCISPWVPTQIGALMRPSPLPIWVQRAESWIVELHYLLGSL